MDNVGFVRKHGQFFRKLISRMGKNLSDKARLAAENVFTD